MTEKQQRRRWAQSKIDSLLEDRKRIDHRIEELKAFLALLEQSDAAVSKTNGGRPAAPSPTKRTFTTPTLGDYLVRVLKAAGAAGLTVAEATDGVIQVGYQHASKIKVGTAVGSELHRQARKSKRGIVKISTGRYAYSPTTGKEAT